MRPTKTWERIGAGSRNIAFDDLVRLAEAFGFVLKRIRGSHHILIHPNIPGMLNFQPDGPQAKAYQVRQLVSLVQRYQLTLRDEDK